MLGHVAPTVPARKLVILLGWPTIDVQLLATQMNARCLSWPELGHIVRFFKRHVWFTPIEASEEASLRLAKSTGG